MTTPRPYLIQSREQYEACTDPQRRCYNGAFFSSEMCWTQWSTLYGMATQEEAEESVRTWQDLAKSAKPRVLEYRVHKEES